MIWPYRKVRGWRLWVRGFRDAIEQRGVIGWSTSVGADPTGARQEDLDRGLTMGEQVARRVWTGGSR